tara:strand:+ start:114216 stop:114911 length:696 start_codon:yes stop_codon:yes gene_type:complete
MECDGIFALIMPVEFSLNALSEAPNQPLWLTLLLMAMFFAYAALSRVHPAINVLSVFSGNTGSDYSRNDNDNSILALFSLANMALFVFLILPRVNDTFTNSFILFFAVFIGILLLYFSQLALLFLLNYLIEQSKSAQGFGTLKTHSTLQITFPLIILNFIIYCSPIHITQTSLIVSAALISIILLMYLFRLVKVGLKQKLPLWYIILYFCALELVPIALVAKSLFGYGKVV